MYDQIEQLPLFCQKIVKVYIDAFLLPRLERRPRYLLVENVVGFEVSETHSQLMACLTQCGYTAQQFMLTPLQFGIPNCRLRYYLIARLDGGFSFKTTDEVFLMGIMDDCIQCRKMNLMILLISK